MHPSEYERYLSLQQSANSTEANLDIQQPIVSTIKSNHRVQNDFLAFLLLS